MTSTVTTATTSVVDQEQSLTPEFSREELAREAEYGYKRFGTVDGILRSHAADPSNPVLFAYPVHGVADFEEYTAKDLDRFVDAAAAKYISFGVLPAVRSGQFLSLWGILRRGGKLTWKCRIRVWMKLR